MNINNSSIAPKLPVIISVIICTHRRPGSLLLSLESLTHQTWHGGGWEIIVVENDSEPSSTVSGVVSSFMPRLPLRHFIEKIPNLSRARNHGAQMAYGKYLAYIDDDAEATEGWLEALMQGLKEFQPDFCGGPSYPLFRIPKPAWFRDEYAIEYFYGDKPQALKYAEWLGGMNFIVQRKVVLSLGGFREELGMAGDKIAYGEETCLLMDGWKNNQELKVMYLPTVAVYHEVRPVKMTMRWNIKSWWAGGRDSALMNLYGNRILTNIKMVLSHAFIIIIRMMAMLPTLCKYIMNPDAQRYKRYIFDTMKSNIYWSSYGINSLFLTLRNFIDRRRAKR